MQFLDGPIADWRKFRLFMLSRWDDIAELMAARSTQANEAARCAAFLPVLASIRSPIALIEVGAAAGLCLFPDRYSYNHTVVGDAPVRIDVDCSGAVPVPVEMPDICWRRGIDLNPLDVTDPADVKWLRSCIWPEHDDRRDRLERAVRPLKPNAFLLGRNGTELLAHTDPHGTWLDRIAPI